MNEMIRVEWELLFESFITLLLPLPPPLPVGAANNASPATAAAIANANATAQAAQAAATNPALSKQQVLAARQAAEKAAAIAALAVSNDQSAKSKKSDPAASAVGPNWRRLLRACMGLVVGLSQLESASARDEKTSDGGASGAGGDEDDSEQINKMAAARAVTRTIESRSSTKMFAVHCIDLIVHHIRV